MTNLVINLAINLANLIIIGRWAVLELRWQKFQTKVRAEVRRQDHP